jgi:hypothetical protein
MIQYRVVHGPKPLVAEWDGTNNGRSLAGGRVTSRLGVRKTGFCLIRQPTTKERSDPLTLNGGQSDKGRMPPNKWDFCFFSFSFISWRRKTGSPLHGAASLARLRLLHSPGTGRHEGLRGIDYDGQDGSCCEVGFFYRVERLLYNRSRYGPVCNGSYVAWLATFIGGFPSIGDDVPVDYGHGAAGLDGMPWYVGEQDGDIGTEVGRSLLLIFYTVQCAFGLGSVD